MLLYHGTSFENWKDFLRYGIEPRGDAHGVSGFHSNSRNAYLTSWMAPLYAIAATPPGELLFLIEIDLSLLDASRLAPDDDFIALIRLQAQGIQVEEHRARWYQLDVEDRRREARSIHAEAERKSYLWWESLRDLGTVGHRGTVPPDAFTRLAWSTRAALCESSAYETAMRRPGGVDASGWLEMTQWFFNPAAISDGHQIWDAPSLVLGQREMDRRNGAVPPRSHLQVAGIPETQHFTLWKKASVHFALDPRISLHGLWHWRRVENNGAAICNQSNADAEIVHLFATLHDAARQDEGHDPKHGVRAALLARQWRDEGYFEMDEARCETLCEAIRLHADGHTTDEPTIGACWDADRLDLPRVGIAPDPALLSTQAARALLRQ